MRRHLGSFTWHLLPGGPQETSSGVAHSHPDTPQREDFWGISQIAATNDQLILKFNVLTFMQFASGARWDLIWDLLLSLSSSARSHAVKADTYTQIRVTDSPRDASHDNTLNPTWQHCCPERSLWQRSAVSRKLHFRLCCAPCRRLLLPAARMGAASQPGKCQKTDGCFLLLTDCSPPQKCSSLTIRLVRIWSLIKSD